MVNAWFFFIVSHWIEVRTTTRKRNRITRQHTHAHVSDEPDLYALYRGMFFLRPNSNQSKPKAEKCPGIRPHPHWCPCRRHPPCPDYSCRCRSHRCRPTTTRCLRPCAEWDSWRHRRCWIARGNAGQARWQNKEWNFGLVSYRMMAAGRVVYYSREFWDLLRELKVATIFDMNMDRYIESNAV